MFPKTTIILRGYDYETVDIVCELLIKNNAEDLFALELTTNSPDAFTTLQKITDKYGKKIWIGMGTILEYSQAEQAVNSGARFLLAPVVMEQEVIDLCKEHGVLTVPAAFTPSEVYSMSAKGADIIKLFPVNALSDSYVKDISGPLGKLPLMAVGGVNVNNAKEILAKGIDYLGIGSGMFSKELLKEKDGAGLEKELINYIEVVYG
ncbi:2-dehydro-3-deoxyphosphogluconate aldolase [Aerococcaceae bacterium DSM 111022]|nr:2-dehydro-3-deoxyphosphogluconate aldolase [Aerococcaceae bacterium DSM 111022]